SRPTRPRRGGTPTVGGRPVSAARRGAAPRGLFAALVDSGGHPQRPPHRFSLSRLPGGPPGPRGLGGGPPRPPQEPGRGDGPPPAGATPRLPRRGPCLL